MASSGYNGNRRPAYGNPKTTVHNLQLILVSPSYKQVEKTSLGEERP